MPRFFVNSADISDGYVTLSGDNARHISLSLRMACKELITVCDDTGLEYEAELCEFHEGSVRAKILSQGASDKELPVRVTLYQGYPKSDKLEFIIQKAVELGASKIVPFESERCIKRPDAEKSAKRSLRFSKIAEEAAKQCQRAVIPSVSLPVGFETALSEAVKENDAVFFCYEGGGTPITKLIRENKNAKSIAVFVGSEGGFSENEAALAKSLGAKLCGLGNRILRCETAPLFALSAIICGFEL